MVSLKGDETNALLKPDNSNSAHSSRESTVVKNNKVIALGMFRINPFNTSREEHHVPNKPPRASVMKKPITVTQPSVIPNKIVNYNGSSSTGVDNTTKTRRPQPRNAKSEVVCPMCKKYLVTANHDGYVLNSMNDMNYRGSKEGLALPTPRKPSISHRNLLSNGFQIQLLFLAGCPNFFMLLVNFVWNFLGTVRFENDHVAAIMGFGDLQWGNILITRVYFIEGLGHNLFSVGQFCDSDLEVAFRRNACFVRNLEGVDLLKRDRSTNLYTINLHEMASASPICLMARASSTKSWLWHQRLSHLNFDTINDLARNDLVAGLPKFKYHKEHLCPSCEEGKSKRASHPPKPVPNSRQRLHLFHIDLCGPMRIASINGKRYILVIVDDYSRYTWVHFLRFKDEAPAVIITFLKRTTVLL
nr:retrovirus-related Pol polyprotein from transposon TNT 1-94 [Tanacetum cinerariifolium]